MADSQPSPAPPAGDASLVSKLDELYAQARSARRGLEPQWLMNLAFFQGRQWLAFGNAGLYEPPLEDHRITQTENRIAGIVRTELSKMTKNRPVFVVTPNTGDEEDANAAALAERLMRYMWKHLHMPELMLKALEWSRICGAGFLKCYWDSTIGEQQQVLIGPDGNVIQDPQSGRPMRGDSQAAALMTQQFGSQVSSKAVAQGDVRVEVRSPFQMFIDPLCDSFTEAEWLIEESVKSKEYVLRRYGVELKPDAPSSPGLVEQSLGGAAMLQGANAYKGIKVREYWCKPSSEYPSGVRIVWAQRRVLDRTEKPFDPMPYAMLSSIPVPGRLWPMSIVDLARGPNVELNKTLSQMAENRNRIANPTGIASQQAIRDPEKFLGSISRPGGWHFFDETGSQHPIPQYLEAPTLPDYVKEMPARSVSAMEDISGQHEVTNAQVPPGVTAASAITLLQEADDTRLAVSIHDFEENLGRFGHKILDLVANFYTDARTIQIGGDDAAWEIIDFRGSKLRGNTELEVRVGLPQSKAAQQAGILDWLDRLIQSGNPPHGRQLAQALRDFDLGGEATLLSEYTVNETQVNSENARLCAGMPLQINPYDDDGDHITGHEDLQKSSRYLTLDPQIQQNIQAHVDAHKQRQQQQQQQQMAQQAQMQAMASGKPPPDQQAQQAAQQAATQQQEMAGTAQQQQADAQSSQMDLQQQGLQQLIQAAQGAHDGAQAHQQRAHADERHAREMAGIEQKQQHERELHQQRLQAMRNSNRGGQRG